MGETLGAIHMETFALVAVAFLAVAFVVGMLWSRSASYQEHLRFKQAMHNAKRGISPIIED